MYIYVLHRDAFPPQDAVFFCVPYKTGDLRRSNDFLVKIWWLTSSGSSSTDEPICWYIYIYTYELTFEPSWNFQEVPFDWCQNTTQKKEKQTIILLIRLQLGE